MVLYDNSPLVTPPGGGSGGADASALQTALGLASYGFGHQLTEGYRVADDFTVPAGGWYIASIIFFAYQTGSTTTSTIDHVTLRIWDGVPGETGSNVVFGDTTTNRLVASTWSNIYRVIDTDMSGTTRPIMVNRVNVGITLPPGTYWLDWQSGGTLPSGPWAPPVTLLGQTGKAGANARQFTSEWNPALDAGTRTPQDFPFIVETAGLPNIDVNPLSLASTQPPNTTTSQTLNIGNTGGSNLTWNIAEGPSALRVVGPMAGSSGGTAATKSRSPAAGWTCPGSASARPAAPPPAAAARP